MYPTEIPTVSSLAAGVDLSIIGNIELYVDLANGSSVYALTLGLVSLGEALVAGLRILDPRPQR